MQKIFFLILITSLLLTLPKFKEEAVFAAEISKIEVKTLNPRAKILEAYFEKYNSPLKDSADDFIEAADTYNLDWKLVPSIAGVESTFGKNIPGGFNGWGWGVYGTQAIYFKSWRDGIFTVSKGLKENYIDQGLDTPYKMNLRYATSKAWGWKVDYFMNDLDLFAKDLTLSVNVDANLEEALISKPKTAAQSALLTLSK